MFCLLHRRKGKVEKPLSVLPGQAELLKPSILPTGRDSAGKPGYLSSRRGSSPTGTSPKGTGTRFCRPVFLWLPAELF